MKQVCLFLVLTVVLMASGAWAQTIPQNREQIKLSFAPLVKQATPAVVNIYTQKVVQQRMSPLFADPLFQQFFGGRMPQGMTRQRMENSLGSGVIVRADGLIVTSNHVVEGADEIRVVLSDRREFDATILTADAPSDLAVLRIETKGEKLPFIELRDSDEAEVGDLVLAIGNPFGVGQTVTSGIISAMAHKAVGSSDLDYFIQTDAAINPGNSGGALITMDGKLVGINAAIYTRGGGNIGIGFAVPSNMVRVVLQAVEQGKKSIVRPWIGLTGQGITADLAASLNMAQPTGILVNRVRGNSPAAKAGIQVGDVILAVNGRTVEDVEAFHYRLSTMSIGTKAELSVLRKGQKLSLSLPMETPPEIPPRQKTSITGRNPLGGATIVNLSPAVAEETGVRSPEVGVIVVDIKNGYPAANLGLQPGDVILSINGLKIIKVDDAVAATRAQPQRWRMVIQRGDEQMSLVVGG